MTSEEDYVCECCNVKVDFLIAIMLVHELVLLVCESCDKKLPDLDVYSEYVILADEL